jgi:hypothetical protein
MDQACAYGSIPIVMTFKGAQLDVQTTYLSGELGLKDILTVYDS